jgi:hypothetical protein
MGRLARAVIALDHHPAIVLEAGEDRPRGLPVELVGRVEVRHIGRLLREGRNLPVEIDSKSLLRVQLFRGRERDEGVGSVSHGHGRKISRIQTSDIVAPADTLQRST